MIRQRLLEFVIGLLFGTGLILSGMAQPAKVIGFLDLAGAWDPSLAFVMGGAVVIGLLAFTLARKRKTTWLGLPLRLPERDGIDRRLLVGSLLFGIGWGLVGFCPGPALVALGAGQTKALGFVAAMLAGMAVFKTIDKRSQS